MSVYLKDGLVLLDSGNVATSQDCCCGGVCCNCDGMCDDTTTQEDCEANGGTWFSDQVCADNPCDGISTGACCNDSDCTIKTQACCENDGGTYQGDDTTCDPNPCTTGACCFNEVCSISTKEDCAGVYLGDGSKCEPLDRCVPPPSCSCAFLNPCDGLFYLSVSYSSNGTFHIDGEHTADWDFTSEVTYTCSGAVVSCSGTGSGSFKIDGSFFESVYGSCDLPGDSNVYASLGGLPYWIYDASFNCSTCPKSASYTMDINECNYKHWIVTDSPVHSGSVEAFITYSNPCI